jgi:hypothetical protein
MTAYAPPPTVVIQDQQLVLAGQLTEAAATRQAAKIKSQLDSLEAAIAALPDGEAKRTLKFRALRLHNELGRGGRLLNDHFQTAQISPDSAGGDKDPNED